MSNTNRAILRYFLQIGIVILLFAASLFFSAGRTDWALASNKFFYGVLRIAQEQGHTVCACGPYQYVRHPGYLGAILFDVATPLILNSAWAYIPAILTVCANVVRTSLEERVLQNGLGGYKNYAQQVRYRLLPAVW